MMMSRRRFLALCGAALLVGPLGGTGCRRVVRQGMRGEQRGRGEGERTSRANGEEAEREERRRRRRGMGGFGLGRILRLLLRRLF
jgi:hypothetical protein